VKYGVRTSSTHYSPLTSNIYLPAIPTIARAFHKQIELINLTVIVFSSILAKALIDDLSQSYRSRYMSFYKAYVRHIESLWFILFDRLSSAPMVWGTLSDSWGRRPTSACCLLVLVLSCIGLALVPTSDYWLLLLLRCLQAAGSASTISIGTCINAIFSVIDFIQSASFRSWRNLRYIDSGRKRWILWILLPWANGKHA
jgi:MFS family permease